MNHLQAGVSRVDITPPIGISMCGYLARPGVSKGIERPLTATALVVTDGREKIVIIACDLIFILNPDVDEIRASIASRLGTRPDCVLLNFSHTHCGPNHRDYSWESDDQKQLQRNFLGNLKNLLRGCAESADLARRPARVGTGFGSAWIGINRREVDEDGKVFLGENPAGVMDPTVGVVRVDELSGKPLAVLFSYGCHTVTMGPKCLYFSPDFPGPAREVIEAATGAKAMFLQAAAGDINPVTGIGATEDAAQRKTIRRT
jgi:neutral ceramidase